MRNRNEYRTKTIENWSLEGPHNLNLYLGSNVVKVVNYKRSILRHKQVKAGILV